MKMYLVLCYDRHNKEWFAYSEAKKYKLDAWQVIREAPTTDMNDRPIKYKIIDFWLPTAL